MPILDDVTQAVGNTPLVRLNRIIDGDAIVAAKLEFYNPASSVKDRIGVAIIDAAEASGELKPGGTVVEDGHRGAFRWNGAGGGPGQARVIRLGSADDDANRRLLIRIPTESYPRAQRRLAPRREKGSPGGAHRGATFDGAAGCALTVVTAR